MEPGAWNRPSPRLRHVRHVEALVPTAAAAAAIAVLLGLKEGALVAVAGAVAVLVAGLALDVLLQRRVGAWAYLEREDDLLVRRGLMVRRLSVVPYGRMQFVDVTAGPVERSFGLATVRLHTAAAASDARIPGLEAAEAARLRDQLAGLGEARAAGL
jgi:membrane protein YdbS with pleckstrin-like domain